MERRYLSLAAASCRLEQRGTEPPVVVGYAAVFYNADDPGTEYQLWEDLCERVMPGCFDRACREDDCRALFNHSPDFVLGRSTKGTLKLSVDKKGLRYEINPPDTQCARDLITNLKNGNIDGSSFSFMVRKQAFVQQGKGLPDVRELHDVELFDVGPVTFPAYAATTAGMEHDYADPIFVTNSAGILAEGRSAWQQWKKSVDVKPIPRSVIEAKARCVQLGI